MARIKPEFDRRGVKVIGLSVDTTRDHERWAKDIEEIRSELSDQSPTRASLSPSFTDVAGEDDRQRQ